MKTICALLLCAVSSFNVASAQEQHSHPAPEKLGKVTFSTSCAGGVQPGFERAVALLHSFAYSAAEKAFQKVAESDPKCAMAYWGVAMSHYHQLWEPPHDQELASGVEAIKRAQALDASTPREKQFIDAAAMYYNASDTLAPGVRAKAYEAAMANVAKNNASDPEAQIFYALALIATAAPTDPSHANQKRAADILEPLYKQFPQHPGLAHYLIHAYDSSELAPRGLAAARAYSSIAPSAPHALHMPSHIFTRLGYWRDSVESNQAARAAAHNEGDVGEELHAMDYLTYAYLQDGNEKEALQVVDDLHKLGQLGGEAFKVGYAATAMPVRLIVERKQWDAAAALQPLPQSPAHISAIVYWARAIASARGAQAQPADSDLKALQTCLQQLRSAKNTYWATQVDVLSKEAQAWSLNAQGKHDEALKFLRSAANQEDAVEKLPVTPGPIVPAREQLGELLLELQRPREALEEFQSALQSAPRRRGALAGAIRAAELAGNTQAATQLRAELNKKI
jgi:tetratricopeptide (TPR) repeat protein